MTTSVRTRRGVRRSALMLSGVIFAALLAASCSAGGSAAQLNAPVSITTKQTVITIANQAGTPINDIKIAVVAYGNTEFTKLLGRMDSAATREVALSELSSRDGTAFNARLSKPKLVRLTAIDLSGKTFDVEVPWK
jgi:hypothetical protein